jgi:hypothetical protein
MENKYKEFIVMIIRKKNWIIILIFVLLIITVKYFYSKNNYYRTFYEFKNNSDVLYYTMPFHSYFFDNFEYPESIEELGDFYSGTNRYYELLDQLKDPFSKDGSDFLYIPLYSPSNLREGYLLISRGIDRKLNNDVIESLYLEDPIKLKLYNDLEIAKRGVFRKFDSKFSFKDYLIGNNDLLIEYSNGVDIFINDAKNRIFTPTDLFKNLKAKRRYTQFDCGVEGQVKRINNDTIVFFDSKCNVICNMYKGRKVDFEESDIIKIVGQYKNKIDTLKNNVYLDNCIVLVN